MRTHHDVTKLSTVVLTLSTGTGTGTGTSAPAPVPVDRSVRASPIEAPTTVRTTELYNVRGCPGEQNKREILLYMMFRAPGIKHRVNQISWARAMAACMQAGVSGAAAAVDAL